MVMQLSHCMAISLSPLIGTMTILTPVSHYDFLINADGAREMMEELNQFLSGASSKLV
jgi:hypothetical protein